MVLAWPFSQLCNLSENVAETKCAPKITFRYLKVIFGAHFVSATSRCSQKKFVYLAEFSGIQGQMRKGKSG